MAINIIKRMNKNLKIEAAIAAEKIELDGYIIVDGDRIYDAEGGYYPVLFYRNGDEIVAVPEFYIGEENVSLIGSRGGEYTLYGETLEKE